MQKLAGSCWSDGVGQRARKQSFIAPIEPSIMRPEEQGSHCYTWSSEYPPSIEVFRHATSYVASKLGSRYSFVDEGVKDALKEFIVNGVKSLRLLDLGVTAMSVPAIESLAADMTRSDSLFALYVESIHDHGDGKVLA